MKISLPMSAPVFAITAFFLAGSLAGFAAEEETPAPTQPVVQGEIPEGWEVVPDESGATVEHWIDLKDGSRKAVQLPRLILRPIAVTESPRSVKVGEALQVQDKHLKNSQAELQTVLSRIRRLLKQAETSNPSPSK